MPTSTRQESRHAAFAINPRGHAAIAACEIILAIIIASVLIAAPGAAAQQTIAEEPPASNAAAGDVHSEYQSKYGNDLTADATMRGYPAWTSAEHLWRLDGFSLSNFDGVSLELGPSVVAFGVHGRDVLWAAVIPDEPGVLAASALNEQEAVDRVWLRFHPSRVYELFPPSIVQGPAKQPLTDLEADRKRIQAERLAVHNMRGSFHVGGRPAVPAETMIVLDMRSIEPKRTRRFFVLDQQRGVAMYHAAFEDQVLRPDEPVATDEALRAFDHVWSAFDQQYAMFSLRPHVDWDELRTRYRPRMASVRTVYEAAAVLAGMLETLGDRHVSVTVGDSYVVRSLPPVRMNGNWSVVNSKLPNLERVGGQLAWGRTEDGIGYIALLGLSDSGMAVAFDAVLDRLSETWGLVIDLRFNGGGDEVLGQQIAGRFCSEDHVYSYSRYRNGPARDDLTRPSPRSFSPRGPWQFQSPVIVLQGPQTMSSAESLLLMFDQCPQATRLGATTAGSSGNPQIIDTGIGVRVSLPRWIDLKPDQTPLEGAGVQPDAPVDVTPEQFERGEDPVLDAAFERLRSIPVGQRQPGHRRPGATANGASAPTADQNDDLAGDADEVEE